MSQLATYKSNALARIKSARNDAKMAIHGGEVIAGAAASGFIATKMENIGGVPTDAALGLVLLGIGYGMKQSDVSALGVGFLAGYARGWAEEQAL